MSRFAGRAAITDYSGELVRAAVMVEVRDHLHRLVGEREHDDGAGHRARSSRASSPDRLRSLGVPQPVTWAVATALASLLPVIALLGGIEVLGLAGLIVAPTVMSVFVAAFRLYEREMRFASIPPPTGAPRGAPDGYLRRCEAACHVPPVGLARNLTIAGVNAQLEGTARPVLVVRGRNSSDVRRLPGLGSRRAVHH